MSGASGVLRVSYYSAGSSTVPFTSHTLLGPYSDFWQVTVAPIVPAVYTPCRPQEQRLLNLNTELRVRTGTSDPAATNFMSIGGEDGVGAVYHYAWRRCPL